MSDNTAILKPFTLKTLSLKNRTVVAPMTRVSAEGDGIPTEKMQHYYQGYAKGGFGLIITEGTYTDRTYSQGYPNQPGITDNAQQLGWQKVVEQVHKAGGKLIMQLMHAGALSQHLSNTRSASSLLPLRKMLQGYSEKQGPFPLPQAMNQQELDQVIEGFCQGALRAEKAGFDGVEIHGANGYLLDQFLTDYTNAREDQYGGSLENRVRLMGQIIAAVKQQVGAGFVVGVRVSQGKVNDFDYQWPGGVEDGKVIFSALKQAGSDYIHFASEGKGFEHGCMTVDGKSLPQLAREMTALPVIVNGGMENIQLADKMLKQGHGDLLSLGTGALANPDWPIKVEKGLSVKAFSPDMLINGVAL